MHALREIFFGDRDRAKKAERDKTEIFDRYRVQCQAINRDLRDVIKAYDGHNTIVEPGKSKRITAKIELGELNGFGNGNITCILDSTRHENFQYDARICFIENFDDPENSKVIEDASLSIQVAPESPQIFTLAHSHSEKPNTWTALRRTQRMVDAIKRPSQ
jgi:hypothetical protein